jgi:serine/threonine-protein kinase
VLVERIYAALMQLISWKILLLVSAVAVIGNYGALPPVPWISDGLRAIALLIDSELAAPAAVPAFLSVAEAGANSWYQYWDERVALAIVVLYAMFLQPRLQAIVAALLMVFALAGLVIVQVSVQVVVLRWLPIEYLVGGALVSYVIMALWTAQRTRWRELIMISHRGHSELAGEYLSQSRLDDTLRALANCLTTGATLESYYEVALKQESKRQYKSAINTFELLQQRQSGYKDVRARLQQLRELAQPRPLADDGLGKTIAMGTPLVSMPVLGRYQVERELGRGAMGVVYLGRDPKISRHVAIKTLAYSHYDDAMIDDLKARFYREAEAAGRLNHPNIVTVYDVGEEADLSYIAMDYAEGEALSRHCHPGNLLPVATVYQIVAEVADALDYAHKQNVIHRDIKPSNLIFNTDTEQLKITDFGIARIVDSSSTRTGEILGSPIYLSPELLKGEKATGATDIYSLGVTFYQLLTGHVPFNGENVANVAYQIVNSKYKSVRSLRSDLPSSAVRIVNKAMNRQPEKRFANAAEMAAEVRKRMQHDFKLSA